MTQQSQNQNKKTVKHFGKNMISDFYMDPNLTNINHGSFGACPKIVLDEKRVFQERMEFSSDKFFRHQARSLIKNVRQEVSEYVKCPLQNIYLVQNATDAFNSLVKSIIWQKGDIIALTSTAYECVKKTIEYLYQRYQINIFQIDLKIQDLQTSQTLQNKLQKSIKQCPSKIKLAVLDHIISVPSIVVPLKPLINFFRNEGIRLYIDGAHAFGQLQINIQQLKPDAYFSNFHKWGFAPKSCAFLYISDDIKKEVHPNTTSNRKGQGLQQQFYWTGTKDISAFLAIPKAIEYIQSIGYKKIQEYNRKIAYQGAKRMVQIWKTKLLTDDRTLSCNMCNIIVPSNSIDQCKYITKHMQNEKNCFPMICLFDGKIICRISAQIYNQIEDYEKCAKWFLQLQQKYNLEKSKKSEVNEQK